MTKSDLIDLGVIAFVALSQIVTIRRIEKLMAISRAQLTADVNALATSYTSLAAAVDQAASDFQAEVAALKAANPTEDFSDLDGIITNLKTTVDAETAKVTVGDPGPQQTGNSTTSAPPPGGPAGAGGANAPAS